jgi:hypothetical protein
VGWFQLRLVAGNEYFSVFFANNNGTRSNSLMEKVVGVNTRLDRPIFI